MLCKIADLITEVPETGGLSPRLREYQWRTEQTPDLVIDESQYRPAAWKGLPWNQYCYMESGIHFYANLLYHKGLMLHASAVAYRGRAYLFSGNSGVGKSTHTQLWQQVFGKDAQVFNDDKPALRYPDGQWFAYGTPWSGKNGININLKVPLAGICFLEQGRENRIDLLSPQEAISHVLPQTLHRFKDLERAYLMLEHVENLLSKIPVFHLVNQPCEEAVHLAYEAMAYWADQRGL
jgi:hypothetical protein